MPPKYIFIGDPKALSICEKQLGNSYPEWYPCNNGECPGHVNEECCFHADKETYSICLGKQHFFAQINGE